MKKIFLIALLAFPLWSIAQSENEAETDEAGMEESMPVFPKFDGGEEALLKYLKDNLKYPSDARQNKVEGTVFIIFEVNEKGEVENSMLMGKDLGSGLSQEAIRLVDSTSGMWTAGKIDGELATIKLRVPIRFEL